MEYEVDSQWWCMEPDALVSRPFAMGMIDLTSMDLSSPEGRHLLRTLSTTLILRVIVSSKQIQVVRDELLGALVIDDHYDSSCSRAFSASITDPPPEYFHQSTPQAKEMRLLTAFRELPLDALEAEFIQLDILFEDYLCYAHAHNAARIHTKLGHKSPPRIPVACPTGLLRLPLSKKLPLSVLLTAVIVFPNAIPLLLLQETMILLLAEHFSEREIHDMISLPSYVKTSVVSLLRRLCRREVEDSAEKRMRRILEPPLIKQYPYPFQHLKSSHDFLSFATDTAPPLVALSFSEKEVFAAIPHIPTLRLLESSKEVKGGYQSWPAVIARQTVLLLMKASTCPNLTRPQCSAFDQKHYNQLLPLLRYASLTYEDMNISSDLGRKAKEILQFGSGVPNGSIDRLSWNQNLSSALPPQGRTLKESSITDEMTPRSVESHISQRGTIVCKRVHNRAKVRVALHSYAARPISVTTAPELDVPVSESEKYLSYFVHSDPHYDTVGALARVLPISHTRRDVEASHGAVGELVLEGFTSPAVYEDAHRTNASLTDMREEERRPFRRSIGTFAAFKSKFMKSSTNGADASEEDEVQRERRLTGERILLLKGMGTLRHHSLYSAEGCSDIMMPLLTCLLSSYCMLSYCSGYLSRLLESLNSDTKCKWLFVHYIIFMNDFTVLLLRSSCWQCGEPGEYYIPHGH